MDDDAAVRLQEHRRRIRATLQRVISTLEWVISANEELAQHAGHEASARQRVDEAHREIAQARAELDALAVAEEAATNRTEHAQRM